MVLFEQYARHASAIARIGEEVRAMSRATGTAICYTEAAYGTQVIREYPGTGEGRRVGCGHPSPRLMGVFVRPDGR